ncbi:hypothetical protein [Halobacterium wangiae]|uniref:hypothetical protein n=1 Tax=Halobacterium wangiae TaxID=2902623 RepID=UPI001E569910|nr:hypothetical protein [Halobacterium wangiae]
MGEAVTGFSYDALDLGFTPPVRGGDRPADWAAAVDTVAEEVATVLQGARR